jgi:hypothetical protein
VRRDATQIEHFPDILTGVQPAEARSRLPAIGVALFGLLAVAGATSREWHLLHRPGDWGAVFSGPGDFAPANIVTALVHGASVATAYAHSGQPYPLPYLLAFAPFGLVDDP